MRRAWRGSRGLSEAEAADGLDRVVYQILENLRRNQEAPFPGPGTFQMSRKGNIHFESEAAKTDN